MQRKEMFIDCVQIPVFKLYTDELHSIYCETLHTSHPNMQYSTQVWQPPCSVIYLSHRGLVVIN